MDLQGGGLSRAATSLFLGVARNNEECLMWYNVWPWTQYDPAFNILLGARNEASIPGLSRFPGEVSLRSAPYNPAWHDLSVLHSGTMMLH